VRTSVSSSARVFGGAAREPTMRPSSATAARKAAWASLFAAACSAPLGGGDLSHRLARRAGLALGQPGVGRLSAPCGAAPVVSLGGPPSNSHFQPPSGCRAQTVK
jgi:hypothetical protein